MGQACSFHPCRAPLAVSSSYQAHPRCVVTYWHPHASTAFVYVVCTTGSAGRGRALPGHASAWTVVHLGDCRPLFWLGLPQNSCSNLRWPLPPQTTAPISPALPGLIILQEALSKPSSVVHTCNPSYLGSGTKRITVQDQPRQKVSETLGLEVGSNSKVPALQVQIPEFKLQSHQK
jgi:hypothetical protein